MQINSLKLKNKRKKKKTIGRGGKKGTYCGRGGKGQSARSGSSINPLFEGGRSTLIDHMKKLRGFKSPHAKKNIVKLDQLESKFKDGETVDIESLIKNRLVGKIEAKDGVKILGGGKISKKLTFHKDIFLSASAKEAIQKAGGKVASSE
jgi:large subunit ribosomal protein L15